MRRAVLGLTLLLAAAAVLQPGGAVAEQATQPSQPAAGYLATGDYHSCAVIPDLSNAVRCWGFGGSGQLGYGNPTPIGDDETPASAGPVDLGAGRSATDMSAGDVHTCAVLDNGSARCWGFAGNGRLGYAGTAIIGDDEAPGSVGPIALGAGRTAKTITAGNGHTCAILDNDAVRCWGFGLDGRLGYGDTADIGDDETPATAGPVNLGAGRTAAAITAGGSHTCAIMDDGNVRCWGFAGNGRLGYGNLEDIGQTPDKTPDKVGPVYLGAGRTARAISAGFSHTCAILDTGAVRCWGFNGSGRLGTGNFQNIGDNETPGSIPTVDLGAGRTAKAITAGGEHTCAILDNDTVRCWGYGAFGQLGYGNSDAIGDNETPGAAGPVDLGAGRTARAISAGALHTCALLDDGSIRCWGYGANGRVGYCNEAIVGDNEVPGSLGPVALGQPGIAGQACPAPPVAPPPPPVPPPPPPVAQVAPPPPPPASQPQPAAPTRLSRALTAERAREKRYRSCLRKATRRIRADRKRARRLPSLKRRGVLRRAEARARSARRSCLRRHSRIPGRVSHLSAKSSGKGKIRLTFRAPGTDARKPPAARRYLVKQSRRPIRTARDFVRGASLCKGRCSFDIKPVGASLELTITGLRSHRRYYYAIAARDNVSNRTGRRSKTTRARAG